MGLPVGAKMVFVGGWNGIKIAVEAALTGIGFVALGQPGAFPHDSPFTVADLVVSFTGALEARNSLDGGSLVEVLGLGSAVEPPGRGL